jgi:repressor LexA
MKALTVRQQEILTFIAKHIEDSGFPPTRLDICAALGFKSPNAAEEHLKALVRKGAISMVPGASRSIRLLHPVEGLQEGLEHLEGLEDAVAAPDPQDYSGKISLASPVQRIKKFAIKAMATVEAGLRIPLVGRVAAGAPILASEHIETEYQIDAGLFPNPPDYLLKVRGMSMRDIGILHDDLLAVKRLYGGLADARDGQIVVARLENEVTVKRLQRDGSQVLLLPENPDFQPIVVDPERDFLEIEGLGIGVIRNPRAGL